VKALKSDHAFFLGSKELDTTNRVKGGYLWLKFIEPDRH